MKTLITMYLLVVGVGYLFGLIHIYLDTGFSFTGVVTHYRGSEKELSVPPDFAFANLIHVHHIHLFSLAMLFCITGIIFTLTTLPEKIKIVFVLIPFAGMLLDFTSFWLLVFASPVFGFFAMTFGGLMAATFFLVIGRPLYEMWILPVWQKRWPAGSIPWFLR